MNSNLTKIGVGIATVITGTALILAPIGADAGVDTHVKRPCLGTTTTTLPSTTTTTTTTTTLPSTTLPSTTTTAFDVVCFRPRPPTKSTPDCRPPWERGMRWSTSQRDGLTSHPAWC